MTISYPPTSPNTIQQLCEELRIMRGLEAIWEYATKVDGSTYFRDKINGAYSNSVELEDLTESASKDDLSGSRSPSALSDHLGRVSAFETYWLEQFLGQLTDPSDDDKAAGPIGYIYDATLAENGEIAIDQRLGYFAIMRQDMIDNRQQIIRNVVSLGSLVAASANVGTVVLTSSGITDHALAGTLVLECTDETIGAWVFSVKNELTDKAVDSAQLTDTVEPENDLTVGKSFEDGRLGVTLLIDLDTPTITGDDGSIFSNLTITNPVASDTNMGKIYIQVERMSGAGGEPDFRVRWYKDANYLPENLVTSVDVNGLVGSETLTMSGSATGTQVEVDFDEVNAAAQLPVDGNTDDIVFDLVAPRQGDVFRIAVANDMAGKIQSKIVKRWRVDLPSGPAKPGSAITGALAGAGAGNVDNGTHSYKFTFVTTDGYESGGAAVSNTVTVADKTVNGKVDLTGIIAGPAGTAKRRVYRTIAGAAVTGPWKLLTEIADNVTTTYQDNTADASLGATIAPTEIDDTLANNISIS